MGYAGQVQGPKTYYPSDEVIAEDAASELITNNLPLVKYKTFQLVAHIGSSSKLRYKFTLTQGGAGANLLYGQIYRNGSWVGAYQTTDATVNPNVFIQDINTTNWTIGDTIEVWCAHQNAVGTLTAFQLCGVGSEWEVV